MHFVPMLITTINSVISSELNKSELPQLSSSAANNNYQPGFLQANEIWKSSILFMCFLSLELVSLLFIALSYRIARNVGVLNW